MNCESSIWKSFDVSSDDFTYSDILQCSSKRVDLVLGLRLALREIGDLELDGRPGGWALGLCYYS
jgi:hypothetical protein